MMHIKLKCDKCGEEHGQDIKGPDGKVPFNPENTDWCPGCGRGWTLVEAQKFAEAQKRTIDADALCKKLEAEVLAVTKDRDSWKHEFEMFANAWLRELGGRLIPKAHRIDALVITTRHLYDSLKKANERVRELEELLTVRRETRVDDEYLRGIPAGNGSAS